MRVLKRRTVGVTPLRPFLGQGVPRHPAPGNQLTITCSGKNPGDVAVVGDAIAGVDADRDLAGTAFQAACPYANAGRVHCGIETDLKTVGLRAWIASAIPDSKLWVRSPGMAETGAAPDGAFRHHDRIPAESRRRMLVVVTRRAVYWPTELSRPAWAAQERSYPPR
jgi:hypothetical protein